MKKLAILMIVALLAMGVVSATDGDIEEEYVTMNYNDQLVNTFCLEDNGVPVTNFDVTIDVVWQELDNVLGYSAGDVLNPTGFDVSLIDIQTDGNGCADFLMETHDEDGTFGYTIGGWNGQSVVGPEDGYAFVPEFGVVAAFLVLAAAGLFIYKKRN